MSEIEFAEVVEDETGLYLRIWKDDKSYSFLVEDVLERMQAAQQSVQPTLLESGQKFAPESVNPYPCDTN